VHRIRLIIIEAQPQPQPSYPEDFYAFRSVAVALKTLKHATDRIKLTSSPSLACSLVLALLVFRAPNLNFVIKFVQPRPSS